MKMMMMMMMIHERLTRVKQWMIEIVWDRDDDCFVDKIIQKLLDLTRIVVRVVHSLSSFVEPIYLCIIGKPCLCNIVRNDVVNLSHR